MIVWGGGDFTTQFDTGGRGNDPNTDSRTATSTTNAPSARQSHTAVWAIDLNRPGGSGEPSLPFQRRWLRTP